MEKVLPTSNNNDQEDDSSSSIKKKTIKLFGVFSIAAGAIISYGLLSFPA